MRILREYAWTSSIGRTYYQTGKDPIVRAITNVEGMGIYTYIEEDASFSQDVQLTIIAVSTREEFDFRGRYITTLEVDNIMRHFYQEMVTTL